LIDSLTGRTGEVAEALSDRKADVACIQETQWKGSGCKFYGAKGKRYKLFWIGGEERLDGVIHSGKLEDEKESLFHLLSCIPQNEVVV